MPPRRGRCPPAGSRRRPRLRVGGRRRGRGGVSCDRYLDAVDGEGDRDGIHSHGDGIVHVDGQVIVVALVPKGTSYAELGPPPSESYLPKVRGLTP